MQILQIGDIHAREQDLPEVMKCLETVYQTASLEKPGIIINTGDTFDNRNIRLDSETARQVFRFFSRLSEIAPVAILIGTPSHDGLSAKILDHGSFGHGMIVSDRPEQLSLIEGDLYTIDDLPQGDDSAEIEAIISMVPQPTKQFWQSDSDIKTTDEEISNALTGLFAGFGAQAEEFDCPHILAFHGSIRGATISTGQVMIGRDIEISKEQIGLANADLVCCGHIHKMQYIEPNIYYQGSLWRTDFGEMEAKGFLVHDLLPEGRESHFVETPTRKLMKLDYDFTRDGVVPVVGCPTEGMDGVHLRVNIRVWQDEADRHSVEEITKLYMDGGCEQVYVKIIRVPRETVRSEKILKLTSLREKIQERAALAGEDVAESILRKCDVLETTDSDDVVGGVTVYLE